jgi:hypothetical protein
MRKITKRDVLKALVHVNQRSKEKSENEKEYFDNSVLLKYNPDKDLHIPKGKVVSVVKELQQVCHVEFPVEIYKIAPDNSVPALVTAINQYIQEYDIYQEKNC